MFRNNEVAVGAVLRPDDTIYLIFMMINYKLTLNGLYAIEV